jgi:type I restriction enzyme S subunit
VKLKKLDELCDFISGLWTGKNPPFINVGVIRNTNFHKSGNLNFENIAELDVEVKQFKTRQLKFGDIILEKSGGGPKQPVGRVCIFEKEDGQYSLSNFTSAIRIKNKKELDNKYLHYFLLNLYATGKT